MTEKKTNTVTRNGVNYEIDQDGYGTGRVLDDEGNLSCTVPQMVGRKLIDPQNPNPPPFQSWEFG